MLNNLFEVFLNNLNYLLLLIYYFYIQAHAQLNLTKKADMKDSLGTLPLKDMNKKFF